MSTIDDACLQRLLPKREQGVHKWDVGGVLVVAGSPQYPGAAWLACRTAGRNGAGIVYLATPRSIVASLAGSLPEVAYIPLPDSDAPGSARRTVERISEAMQKVRSLVIGPGLGNDDSTDFLLSSLFGLGDRIHRSSAGFGFGANFNDVDALATVFERFGGQIVVDADALSWLARQGEWWEHVPPHRLVLTPHPGEASRLSGEDASVFVDDAVGAAKRLAAKWRQTVVIKSGFTAASDGEKVVAADSVPTSLATAGSGDCLAGAIGAYLAQGCSPIDASTLAIGIGCRAAIELEKIWGVAGVLATDLPDMMARTILRLSDQR